MSKLTRLRFGWDALRQLGPKQVGLYGIYQAGLRTGTWKARTPCQASFADVQTMKRLPLAVPEPDRLREILGAGVRSLLADADAIVEGQYRPFWGELAPLELKPAGSEAHWSEAVVEGDIKMVWEPARFGWAYRLAEAYLLTGDQRYVIAVLYYLQEFMAGNPVNCGPNWASGQEVALRLMALAAVDPILALEDEHREMLAGLLYAHARRIDATLVYARAQHNNHLLTEAAGLMTAGILFSERREGKGWLRKGWKWLNRGLQAQIAPDGTYAQHSTNYHRLMLHTALWGDLLRRSLEWEWPHETLSRLAAATGWLAEQVDRISGDAPNLGHNDGALILPLGGGDFRDFRPVVQAAGRAFGGGPVFIPGGWDALSLWLGLMPESESGSFATARSTAVHRLEGETGDWATLRAVTYTSRPGQADPLQVELWWRGWNILCDPGSYAYNASPPWDNGLASGRVHNGVIVDGQEPMRKAGRFLWLDWAQSLLVSAESQAGKRVVGLHNGYRQAGIGVRRQLEKSAPGVWSIHDAVNGKDHNQHRLELQWLLPDGEWRLEGQKLEVETGAGKVTLAVETGSGEVSGLRVIRCGQVVAGPGGDFPLLGWFSPTYMHKKAALTLQVEIVGALPLTIITLVALGDAPAEEPNANTIM